MDMDMDMDMDTDMDMKEEIETVLTNCNHMHVVSSWFFSSWWMTIFNDWLFGFELLYCWLDT